MNRGFRKTRTNVSISWLGIVLMIGVSGYLFALHMKNEAQLLRDEMGAHMARIDRMVSSEIDTSNLRKLQSELQSLRSTVNGQMQSEITALRSLMNTHSQKLDQVMTSHQLVTKETSHKSNDFLIMSMAAGSYMRSNFVRFVGSLRMIAKYDGGLVLFVSRKVHAFKDPTVLPMLQNWNTDLVYTVEDFDAKITQQSANLKRYTYYYKYLESQKHFKYILWSDFRDVIFQRNPFDDFDTDRKGKELLVFGQHPLQPLDKNSFTNNWLKMCFGKQGLERVLESYTERPIPVLCSSNLMGTRSAVLNYLREFTSLVNTISTSDKKQCLTESKGIDQGIHNYLVYTKIHDSLTICPWDDGPVSTVGQLKTLNLLPKHTVDTKTGIPTILRKDGRSVPLVHQADRLKPFDIDAKVGAYLSALLPKPKDTEEVPPKKAIPARK